MNQIKKELETKVSNLLKNAHEIVLNPENIDMLMPHPKHPHCESYVVELVDSIKEAFVKSNLNVISKSDILSIFYKYSGTINADQYRLNDIMKYA